MFGKIFKIVRKKRLRRRRHIGRRGYLQHKEQARTLVKERLAHFNTFYKFDFKKVFIKNQKSVWGSCSTRKNLNFNYKIIFLSPQVADYLIVHELCHLKEMNHRAVFWSLVEKTVPNYKKLRKELRAINSVNINNVKII